jgi:protein phosphatase
MSPVATSRVPGMLEHPAEAFEAYSAVEVNRVVCQEKHMGSRAMLLVCRESGAFGIEGGGAVWTRTGRPFFPEALTSALLERLRAAVVSAGLFDELDASWLLFDSELLPWNVKAGELLREQYAAVGAAARASLPVAMSELSQAAERGIDVSALLARTGARAANAERFTAAYRRYCWPTSGLDGVRLAPFQLLASGKDRAVGGATYPDRPHVWHLQLADRLVAADDRVVAPTRRLFVDLGDESSVADGVRWWEELTEAGGEGMVVKPAANLVRTVNGLAQPGLKVRGREYLRIIYGPDYTEPANLERLRQRNLGMKRSLALREYGLGLEALDRVARGEPLWRVHECVFAVLALESEPVDPRL